jgi:hypothetical protein
MRLAHGFLIALAPGLAISIAAACAPIFGIQSRYDGPTWCEQDAQATNNGYCNDFDYILPSTVSQQYPANVPDGSTIDVTNAVASSLPNSLYVTSGSIPADGSVVVGNLVSVGAMQTPQASLAPFECQADFYVKDLEAIPTTAAIMGVGAPQAINEKPEILALIIEPDAGGPLLSYALYRFPPPPGVPTLVGKPCPSAHALGPEVVGDWVTVRLFFAPPGTVEAGSSFPQTCKLGLGSDGDRGETGSGDEGGSPQTNEDFVVLAQVGLFDLPPVRFPAAKDGGFAPIPYLAYGLFLVNGSATAGGFGLHVDNVRCTQKPAGVP